MKTAVLAVLAVLSVAASAAEIKLHIKGEPAPPPKTAAVKQDYGILLLAHGGEPEWDAEISSLTAKVNESVPAESALGMADPATLQAALDRLAARGVARVIAVPLFVHSRSEILDQTRYVLGLAKNPSEVLREAAKRMMAAHAGAHGSDPHAMMHHHMFSTDRVKTKLPIILTAALDDDVLVSKILLERARALSRDPKTESVVLVAHGPVDEAAVNAWFATLAKHAEYVRREGGFRVVSFAVLRDDAAPEIRAASVAGLRARVASGAKDGRVLVVPVLIARGGIEGKLPTDLEGLEYAWDGATLMPHDGFDSWVLSKALDAAKSRP
ncbi:MAG: sirohydrochlorin chelatase [Elusimicrobiota bacterium]